MPHHPPPCSLLSYFDTLPLSSPLLAVVLPPSSSRCPTTGTQLAGAGGSGAIVFAQVVDRRFEWKNTEVTVIQPRKIRVQDATLETLEDLEFARDRVVEIGIGFDILLVTTTTQCFIYSLSNLNTPIIFDIRAPPHFLHLSKKHFLTLDQISGLQIISYEVI